LGTLDLEFTELRAPVSGRIGDRHPVERRVRGPSSL
jgi:multidrug resistance efflux pump